MFAWRRKKRVHKWLPFSGEPYPCTLDRYKAVNNFVMDVTGKRDGICIVKTLQVE